MDLFQDLRNEVLGALPHDAADRGALLALDDVELVARLFNWLDRVVPAQPRRVLSSREYSATSASLPPDAAADLQKLVEKIARGDDLGPHLSRLVKEGFAPPSSIKAKKELSKRKDLDLLLNDWDIHHLHPSQQLESDGFVARGDLLLFAAFKPDTAYLLDLMPHGHWSNQHLVEVAVRNWPDAGLFHRLKGGEGTSVRLAYQPSQSDRTLLRSAAITSPIEVDGEVYLSRAMGMSGVGISARSTGRALRLVHTLEDVTEKLKHNPEYLRGNIEAAGREYPATPNFHLFLCCGPSGFGFAVKEEVSGIFIPIVA